MILRCAGIGQKFVWWGFWVLAVRLAQNGLAVMYSITAQQHPPDFSPANVRIWLVLRFNAATT